MPKKNEKKIENTVKEARGASEEKKGSSPAKHSPGAAKMEHTMSQDALRKAAMKPGSGITKH
jgi:hypothetical protein